MLSSRILWCIDDLISNSERYKFVSVCIWEKYESGSNISGDKVRKGTICQDLWKRHLNDKFEKHWNNDGQGLRGFKRMSIDDFLYVSVREWQMQHSFRGFPCLESEHCNQLPPQIITLISCHSIYHCRHPNSYHFSNVYNVQCTELNALMHYFTESLRQLWSRQYNYSQFSRWRNWHF